MSREGHPDVTIVTSGHDVADARLHRLTRALQRRGAAVEVLGLGAEVDAPDGAQVRTWPRGSMVGRGLRGLTMARAARGSVLLALDPDSLIWARAWGRLTGRPVVADVHEDYRRMLEDRAWAQGLLGRGARVVARAAEVVAARADLTLVADEHVPPGRARRRLVVRNEADHELIGPSRPWDEQPRAAYVGDVRASRGLFAMLDALRAAPGWRLDVVGPVAGADQVRVDALLAAEPDLARRISWHGRQPPAQAWAIAHGAWVGFALLEDTPAFRDALPSKLHEYIAAGLVPVVTPLPRQRRLCEEVGGFVVRDGQEAGAVLRRLAAEPELRSRVRSPRAAGTRTSYDVAAEAVLGLVP
ncbi:glycosyltransferase involved in cell wall biosynthesis [Knoellia remsis]|uniref:Glycosyltransferase involved in cell wall biosynthesis n=1 Tax=Knoellia remsis TaxID=407159 RepID=A0A2T0UD67_9MICO|nr:glycosyltransferase [Knoellia remsis]PRY55873.1 glycosyltransferase involved in cell wall biosynthesis [Knoellia remsis]